MNRAIKIALLLFLSLNAFSQKQVKISFDLTEKTIAVNNVLSTDNEINIPIRANDSIAFEMLTPANNKYDVLIKKGSDKVLSLKQGDFKNGNIIKTNNKLSLKGIALPENFSVTITSGENLLIKQNFSITMPPSGPVQAVRLGEKARPQDTQPVEKKVTYKPGSIYYDAMALKNYESLSDELLVTILKYYTTKIHSTNPDAKKIIDTLEANHFLTGVFDTVLLRKKINGFLDSLKRDSLVQHGAGKILSSGFSAVGGLDVTSIADGFAKFLVKRTKQELTVTFFDKFKKLIARYTDLQTVFPETYEALTIIGDEIYNYQAYIQTLRESFERDLSALNTNLPTIIKNHPVFFNTHKELAAMLQSACYVAGELRDKVHPGDILANYRMEFLDSLNVNLKGAIQTLQLISFSLRDTTVNTDSVYWVSSKQVRQLVTDPVALKIYLGLIYQTAKAFDKDVLPITFKDHTLNDVLTSVPPTYNQLKTFITNFGERADKLNTLIRQYKKPANDSLAIEQYYNYIKASVDLLKQASAITNIAEIKKALGGIDLADTLKDYFDVTQSAADLVLNISKRNYSSAIVNTVHIYDIVRVKHDPQNASASKRISDRTLAKNVRSTNKSLQKINTRINAGNATIQIDLAQKNKFFSSLDSLVKVHPANIVDIKYIDTLMQKFDSALINIAMNKFDSLKNIAQSLHDKINSLADSTKNQASNDVKASLFRYGSFMAALVQAKSSDDVENALEAFALPSGSSRIKRVSNFNVSLNAYVGLFGGYEKINGLDSGKGKFNAFGVTAPIGVTAGWGHRLVFKSRREWSTSIFLSLIDLGAVTAFRFKDTATAQVPTIQLKDIFSPGLFLSLGIPKTPLSINLGAQMGPNLRKVNVTDTGNTNPHNNYENKVYWRYSISFCVDLPIFNLYTKSN